VTTDFYTRNANLLAHYRGSGKTCEELIEAYRTAKRENNQDLADGLAEILDEKHPGWDVTSVQKGQGTTHVTYGNRSKSFPTREQAYIWLVETMLSSKPKTDIDDYVLNEMFIKGNHGARHLALSPVELFLSKDGRAPDPNSYHKLSNGWFLNTKLTNKQKREKLFSLAAVCELSCDDWSWEVDGESYESLDSFDEICKSLGLLDPPV
jgi:hypothetical protein